MKNVKGSLIQLKSKADFYFKSKSYEEDLNSIIKLLHVHTQNIPDFNFHELEERVQAKKEYLMNQAGKFLIAGALKGATTAISRGHISMIGEYTIIGIAGALIIIIFTVSGVMIRRITSQEDLELIYS